MTSQTYSIMYGHKKLLLIYNIKYDHSTQISYFISEKSNDTSTLWSWFSGKCMLQGEPQGMQTWSCGCAHFFGISCSTAPLVIKIHRHSLMTVLEYPIEASIAYLVWILLHQSIISKSQDRGNCGWRFKPDLLELVQMATMICKLYPAVIICILVWGRSVPKE